MMSESMKRRQAVVGSQPAQHRSIVGVLRAADDRIYGFVLIHSSLKIPGYFLPLPNQSNCWF